MAKDENELTPERLFKYASNFAKRTELAGQGAKYPTFRQYAKRFRVKIDDIENICADWSGDGYMGAIVAIRAGSGVGDYEERR